MELLIFGRAFAGVGGAGIYSLVLIIISDIVSFRDRGKYQGFIGAVFGLSSVLGPLLGGAFTDGISWRWCFYINLPLGAVSLFVVTVFLRLPGPEGSVAAKLKRIDYLGTLFVLAATICLLISLEFGGKDWAWSDARTIVLLVLAVVLFAVFLVVEAKFAVEPLLPPSMYENPSVYSILAITFLLGASFFGLVYYIPTYFQIVSGNTATQAGLQTIPLVGGVVVFSIVSGQLVSRFGYYTPFFFVGSAFLVVGSALMSTLNQFSNRGMQIGYLLLAGVGIGNMIQIRILGIQASVTPHNIGAATAASAFFMFLGGSVGVAIVGSIFNNVLQNEIGTDLSELVTRNPTGVGSLPTAVRDKVLDGFSKAFDTSYKAIIPMAGLIFILALFVRQARPGARKAETVALGE
nr:hypothetical protein HK105_003892 [Polyrhizophydium stewartii]